MYNKADLDKQLLSKFLSKRLCEARVTAIASFMQPLTEEYALIVTVISPIITVIAPIIRP